MVTNMWNSAPMDRKIETDDDMVGHLESWISQPAQQQTVSHITQSTDSPLIHRLAFNNLRLDDDEPYASVDNAGLKEIDNGIHATSMKQPVRIPVPQPPRRTMAPVIQSTDSPLMPVLTYNGLPLDDIRPHDADPMDWYAWSLKAKHRPLYMALQNSGKVVTTTDWDVARNGLQAVEALQRIEHLKSAHLWSLKQLRRHTSIPRTKTHWDLMLDEMKWMRTDFKEERKWKIATAYMISRAVMEWHQTLDRSSVCVAYRRRRPASTSISSGTTTMMDTPPAAAADATSENMVGQQHTTSIGVDDMDMNMGSDASETTATTASTTNMEASDFLQLVMTYDRTRTMATLPSNNQDEQLDTFTSLFTDGLMYAPPDPNANDPYLNESEYGRIVPVTKLSSFKKYDYSKRTNNSGQSSLPQPSMDNAAHLKTPSNKDQYDPTC